MVQAAEQSGRQVKVWALEEKSDAVIHIQHLVATQG